ncbi:hypothetical protein AB0D68_25435 [Streptomyces sp. NPDC048212]|uniref:hypothetical protein n=1 Tax=unclassified Streptomyces TaxID=2593676 RepID=UPI002274A6C3|nr:MULTISPECIES: hypothetical protein [unclassified Streptomyces]MCY1649307.1 hypothetical protein [Streptomyces sp. SL203]MCY1677019.1 hypothetical protein [Streptomyces sp. SL294]
MFDRAVVWLVDNRVLLPGITTLTRLVAEVRASGNTALYRTLDEAVPEDLGQTMRDLLKVPDGKRVSELERLRTPPMRVSGAAMTAALERAKEVQGLGAHLVPTSLVPAARLSGLARYGMGSKAPTLRDLEETRKTATLPATVQHLETATVDDALDLLDVLMSSRLLSRAERVGKEEKLKSLPRLRRAAGRVARAVGVLLEGKHGGRPPVITDDMLHTVLRRRELGESVEQIQPDLFIPTGKRKGQNPSVASIYRALAEHEKRAAYPEAVEQAHADFAALTRSEVPEPRTEAKALTTR